MSILTIFFPFLSLLSFLPHIMAPHFDAPSTTFSRRAAKDRLSVMLVHQRNNDVVSNIDMDALQAEVAGVIARYVNVARNANAKVGLRQDGDFDLLEMHFPLDQNSLASGSGQKKMAHGRYAN